MQRTDEVFLFFFFPRSLHLYASSWRNNKSLFPCSILVWSQGPFPSSCSNTLPAVWQASESLHLTVLGQVYLIWLSAAWSLTSCFLGQQAKKANNHRAKPTAWRRKDHCVTRVKEVVLQNEPAAHRRSYSHSSSCVSAGGIWCGFEWLLHLAVAHNRGTMPLDRAGGCCQKMGKVWPHPWLPP